MKIVQILPGSGDSFYCENCIRDSALTKALIRLGHDVIVVPMYLPRFLDPPDSVRRSPIFFGGINTYLQHKYPLFRKTPRWLNRIFDSPWFMRMAAKKASSVRASGLGDMTASIIRGQDGHHAKELARLVEWIRAIGQPDIVHVSNALLVGLAAHVRRALKVPVVCSLQDEDGWIDAMEESDRDLCWRLIAERAPEVDAFVAVSEHFAGLIGPRLGVPKERLHVVHIGVDLDGIEQAPLSSDQPAIGYLARMSRCLGLDLLVEAFLMLKKKERHRDLRLRITGGQTGDDADFLASLKLKLAAKDLDRHVEFVTDFSRAGRMEFLRSLSVLSVPVPGEAAFGTYLLEAMAAGVPVVQPKTASFPELLAATGGGILYEPNTPEVLAGALEQILTDKPRAAELGRQGRAAVLERFGIDRMAVKMIEVYEKARASGGF